MSKYFSFTLLMVIISFVLVLYVTLSINIEIRGQEKDDWRLWWKIHLSTDPLIYNHPVLKSKAPLSYYFKPLEWNSDAIEHVHYKSSMPFAELKEKYHSLLKKKGSWKTSNHKDEKDRKVLLYQKKSILNGLNVRQELAITQLEKCNNVSYDRIVRE